MGQSKGGAKPNASDSDEEQWQRVKAQVSAARALTAAGDALSFRIDTSGIQERQCLLQSSMCLKCTKCCFSCHPKRWTT